MVDMVEADVVEMDVLIWCQIWFCAKKKIIASSTKQGFILKMNYIVFIQGSLTLKHGFP